MATSHLTHAIEYLPNVPQPLSDLISVIGAPCFTADDCIFLIAPDSNISTAEWDCVQSDSSNATSNFCRYDGCSLDEDCDASDVCYALSACEEGADDDDASMVCASANVCEDIKVEGEWSNDTMCFVGESSVYASMAEALLCGAECDIDEEVCVDMDSETSSTDCVSEESCCGREGFEAEGCFELLRTVWLIWALVALGVLALCCCGCCCCVCKHRKRKATYDDVEAETNQHYNVYI